MDKEKIRRIAQKIYGRARTVADNPNGNSAFMAGGWSGLIDWGKTCCNVKDAKFKLMPDDTVEFYDGTVISGDFDGDWKGGTFKGRKLSGIFEGGEFEGRELDAKQTANV